MSLQTLQTSSPRSFGLMPPVPAPAGIESVVLRPLKTAEEIETIMHLRGQIDLSAHLGPGSEFRSLEKKETN
jgi:hypothetical protein